MKDYQVAQQIYEALWTYSFSPFHIEIGETRIDITPTDKEEDEDGVRWIKFQARYEDEEYYYEPLLSIRLGPWTSVLSEANAV